MKQKLFVLISTFVIVAAVSGLYFVVTSIRKTPAVPLSAEEVADLAIGQYPSRANSNVMPIKSSRGLPILSALSSEQEAVSSGCSIRLSIVPTRKAVEPHGLITYTITVLNQGKETCVNVSLSDYYTDKEHFISSNPVPTASDYYWSLGDLGSNESRAIEIVTEALVGDGEQILSETCVAADNSKDVCSGNIVFIQKGASVDSGETKNLIVEKVTGAIWGQIFSKKEFGIWVWDSPMKMTDTQASKVIEISKKNGFNVIYISIDDYLRVLEMRNAADRATRTVAYMKELSAFIKAAEQAGIKVDVVGGDKDWAATENRWKGYALINFVKEYNLANPSAKIRGLQYDVEPYLLPNYEIDKKKELKEFLEFIDESVTRMQDVPARFSVVIPHFYDDVQNWTPPLSFKGQDAHTFNHLMKILDRKPDSTVIIMAYRNFFENNNGSKQISEVEIDEASKGKFKTKIIVAQETGNVSPNYVTFYDYPKVSLFDALEEISSTFNKYPNFGGVAVHYFDSFLKME